MESVEFDESQLGDLRSVAEKLFGEENDPRSFAYQRVLERPCVNWTRIVLNCVFTAVGTAVIYWVLVCLGVGTAAAATAACLAFLGCILIRAKAIIICCVRIYQRFAPEGVRKKCRFEPSCSQYMILALEKYGLWKGLSKGIDRLNRCNIHNGGYDFP